MGIVKAQHTGSYILSMGYVATPPHPGYSRMFRQWSWNAYATCPRSTREPPAQQQKNSDLPDIITRADLRVRKWSWAVLTTTNADLSRGIVYFGPNWNRKNWFFLPSTLILHTQSRHTGAEHRHVRPHCRISTVGGAVFISSVLSTRVTPPNATGRSCYPIKTVAANSQIATSTF